MEDSQVSEREALFQWGRRDVIAFVLFFVTTVVFLPTTTLKIMSAFQPGLRIENLSGVQQILIQAIMDIAWVAFILFLVRVPHGRPILRTLHLVRPKSMSIPRLAAAGAFLALMVLLASTVLPAASESPLEKLLSTTASLVFFVVFGIVLAPLLEEIIFRGFLFTAFADIYGVKAAVPVTALLFAGLHGLQLQGNWGALALVFVAGYIFTVVRKRSNSVVPSVIMHTAYNSMIFGISALATVLGLGKGE